MTGVLKRRQALGLLAAALPVAGARAEERAWHDIDVTGTSPSLDFTMMATPEGQTVFQNNYVGYVTMLYFGYTFCPDVCPLTLSNVANILTRLGSQASHVRLLFVTVDPTRDTLPVVAQYAAAFAPQVVGLRGTPDQLAWLARRYRIEYSVTPATVGHPYAVTHSSAIYVFDQTGAARLLIPSLASQHPDFAGVTADLRRLINGPGHKGLLSRVEAYFRGLV
jgi:protein SCO1/2